MIPLNYLQAWSRVAPWPDLRQVEQDLIISRALCDLFNSPQLQGTIAFRGGTAIHKLLFRQPLRYAEDIDLVQIQAEPIGPTVDAIRQVLGWLGEPRREQAGHSMHLNFRFVPESTSGTGSISSGWMSRRSLRASNTIWHRKAYRSRALLPNSECSRS